jgi:hypothetical protein
MGKWICTFYVFFTLVLLSFTPRPVYTWGRAIAMNVRVHQKTECIGHLLEEKMQLGVSYTTATGN